MKLLKKLQKAFTPAKRAAPARAKLKPKPAAKRPVKPAKRAVKVVKTKPKKALKVRPAKPVRKIVKLTRPKPARTKARPLKTPAKRAIRPAPQARPAKPAPQKPAKLKVNEFAQALLQPEVEEKREIKPYPVLPGGQNARITMLVPLLRDLVKKGIISDWLIDFHHSRSANMYVERGFAIEDELSAIREDLLLTIYERFPDGTIGEAQLPIITSEAAEARQQILDAKHTCQYARKKAFDLPEPVEGLTLPQGYDEKTLQAAFAGNGLSIPREMYAQVRTIMLPVLDVKVNCFEILTSASTVRVLNSNGIDISFHKTSVYFEAVLTCKTKTEEREFVLHRVAVSPDQLDLQSLLLQQAQIVRDATVAQPNPGFTGDVLLAGQSVTEVFAPHHDLNPLLLHTSAKLETMGLSSLKLGQPIGQFTGEPITIISNPSLPLGLFTAPVDEEGTPLRPVDLIRMGTFVNYLATARYAQYLGVPATGNIANIQISPGATREQHLRGNNYVEIVSFSWFNPNPFSGDFSAEIRLAYRWVNGRKTPLRGGTLVGNMFQNILSARFSKEITQAGQYYGPRAVLFKGAQIVKFE